MGNRRKTNWNRNQGGWGNRGRGWQQNWRGNNWGNKSRQNRPKWENNNNKQVYSKAWKNNKKLRSSQTIVNLQDAAPEESNLTPTESLQKLVQAYNLSPTIAILDTATLADKTDALQIQIDMDCSQVEDKEPGSFVLRQLAWGRSKDEARNKAIQELLKHPTLVKLQNMIGKPKQPKAEPLFPGLRKK